MHASWKQSSASEGPTAATRKRCTVAPCESNRVWNGGRDITSGKRLGPPVCEIAGSPAATLSLLDEDRRAERDGLHHPVRVPVSYTSPSPRDGLLSRMP